MSTLLHQLRRERPELSDGQRTALMIAVRRLLLDEVDCVVLSRDGQRIRIEQTRIDRKQRV